MKSVKSYCRSCNKLTNHSIIANHTDSFRDHYDCDVDYQIVQCFGCDTKSFRKVFHDIEMRYLTHDDEWIVPEEVTIFPKAVEGHKEIEDLSLIPKIVRKIYTEVLISLKEDAKLLSGFGLRAAVESVCNDLKIKGNNLEIRINKLASAGYISKNDAERLHGIRFMGNDAAHDIKEPKPESISVALQIIEHLIASVYILEKKASGNIDTTISKFESFEKLLKEKLDEFNVGDEYPLRKFMGKDIRRIKDSLSILEQELLNNINNSAFTRLSVGKTDIYQQSSTPLQHYIVK